MSPTLHGVIRSLLIFVAPIYQRLYYVCWSSCVGKAVQPLEEVAINGLRSFHFIGTEAIGRFLQDIDFIGIAILPEVVLPMQIEMLICFVELSHHHIFEHIAL